MYGEKYGDLDLSNRAGLSPCAPHLLAPSALWVLYLGSVCCDDSLWVYGIQLLQRGEATTVCRCSFAGLAVSADLQAGSWESDVERGRCACRCGANSAVVYPSEVIRPGRWVATILAW